MTVTTKPVKISGKKKKVSKANTSKDKGKAKISLKELKAKVYPFPDSNVLAMLDELLQLKLIELPPSKQPEEMDHENDPKYYCYHRIVSHPIKKCFVLKEKIIDLARQIKI